MILMLYCRVPGKSRWGRVWLIFQLLFVLVSYHIALRRSGSKSH